VAVLDLDVIAFEFFLPAWVDSQKDNAGSNGYAHARQTSKSRERIDIHHRL
jgi:hypothetical protein